MVTNSQPESNHDDSKSNVFGNALQTWIEIDLPTLQKRMDEQGLEIKESQKSSLVSRKHLANKTKEFKKLEDSEKLDQFKTLLKLYQNEIDSLTNKNKNVENYFFGTYRLISEAPDPKPLLEMSLDSVIESKNVIQLRSEVTSLQEELAKKADYDQLKQRLLSNEQKSAELLSSKLKAKENEIKSIMEEKENNWQQKSKQYEDRLSTAQKQIEEMRASKEVTELQLDNQNRGQSDNNENSSASVMAELDMVRRDAESSKKRIFDLEKRNEELRREISKSKTDSNIDIIKSECDKRINEMESENILLVANVEQLRKQLAETSNLNESKLDLINRENSQMVQEISNLKNKLNKTSDYEEIKHELQLLRQIEFGHEEDQGDGIEENNVKIDSIVIERNKAMTHELAKYRSQHVDLHTRIDNLEQQLNSSNQIITSLKELNNKLENDLADYQDSNQNKFNDNSSLISGISRMTRPANIRNGSIISGSSGQGAFSSLDESSSILPIITKQRDRFREKNNELEDELRKQINQVNDMKRQIKSLKQDNEELYERSRYLQSFQTPGFKNITTTSSGRKLLNPKPNNNIDLESNHQIEYQRNYENKLHPIEQFRQKEQERISSRLSPLERLFISLTRAVLATRGTRMIFFAYCLGLHIIVMFMTVYAMNIHTSLIPEVGLNSSTGGIASNQAGSPGSVQKIQNPT
ncbi:uncharacterized protein KGF55_001914 [Candida pseudojiufengensis]|uniref:uncharacterized protein n=1 Tax=Candida pseudojiufengensis TaxID=497109 RepID=UPI002224FADD|nr:uncharacterized protein KGF55_001914 [Candida pseudojiufengensis]KAI5964844.1 hypothetical protein KGF55_001914 [Candida pseudojiufengensis]